MDLNQPGDRDQLKVSNSKSLCLRMHTRLIKEQVANSSNNRRLLLRTTIPTLRSSLKLRLTNLTLKSLQDLNKRASQTTMPTISICNSLVRRSKS